MFPATITQKLWKYAAILLADGMSYGDYVEQLTYLLFLNTADERAHPPYNQESPIPKKYNWESLLKNTADTDKNPQGRWRAYSLDELQARNKESWDIFWLRDKSQMEMENLPPPEVLIDEIIKELSAAMDGLKKAKSELRNAGNLSSKKRRAKSQGGRR